LQCINLTLVMAGIALMFAKTVKSSVHAPSRLSIRVVRLFERLIAFCSEIYRLGDPCNQVYFIVAGKQLLE
jgi:hypothetical protein